MASEDRTRSTPRLSACRRAGAGVVTATPAAGTPTDATSASTRRRGRIPCPQVSHARAMVVKVDGAIFRAPPAVRLDSTAHHDAGRGGPGDAAAAVRRPSPRSTVPSDIHHCHARCRSTAPRSRPSDASRGKRHSRAAATRSALSLVAAVDSRSADPRLERPSPSSRFPTRSGGDGHPRRRSRRPSSAHIRRLDRAVARDHDDLPPSKVPARGPAGQPPPAFALLHPRRRS